MIEVAAANRKFSDIPAIGNAGREGAKDTKVREAERERFDSSKNRV
jgi:hypothetical protein